MGNTNRTTYITIIRDPVDIFISAWYYYKLENRSRIKFLSYDYILT